MDRAVFVGRFQPFHRGHLRAIEEILEKVDEVVIVVGSSQYSHQMDNPFTTGERITMIRLALEEVEIPQSRYWLVPVPDTQVHVMWVVQVLSYVPTFRVLYTNEPLTRRLFIESGYKVEPISFHERTIYSSTEIRKRMLNDETWKLLVPKSVAQYIEEIDGVGRLQDLSKTDKLP